MSGVEGEADDVAGLFRKFGGDAEGYREFEPATAAAPTSAAPPSATSRALPAEGPVGRAAAPFPTPVDDARDAGAGRMFDRLFDRLFARRAAQPQPSSDIGHGRMSRWRRPS